MMSRGMCCGVVLVIAATLVAIATLLINTFYGAGFACEEASFPCELYSTPIDVIINSTNSDGRRHRPNESSEYPTRIRSSTAATVCLAQRFFCDGTPHCPNGEDESLLACADLHGSMLLNTIMSSQRTPPVKAACQIAAYPEECFCKYATHLICEGMDRVPDQVTPTVTRMVLSNNSIQQIKAGAFSRYNLELIHLDGNGITHLEPGAFSNQTNLEKLFLRRNQLTLLQPGVFTGLIKLKWLLLSNNHLQKLSLGDWGDLQSLQWLFLSSNELTLEGESFPAIHTHLELFLHDNKIICIEENTFKKLTGLILLDLKFNKIQFIHENAFSGNALLTELDLSHNHLTTMPMGVFSGLHNLSKLSMGNNENLEISTDILGGLWSLSSLDLESAELKNLDSAIFSHLRKLEFVYFKSFYYCTFTPHVPKCKPNTDGVSSGEHLLVQPVLQVSLWLVASFTCIGNIIVLFGRQYLLFISASKPQHLLSDSFPTFRMIARHSQPDENQNNTPSLFIRNLAASDLLMGFYLIVIGIKDISFRGVFHEKARAWMASKTCYFIGILAMTSSEVSVLILTCMSLERFFVIASVTSPLRIARRTANITLAAIWFMGFTLAIIPALSWNQGASHFYGTNGLCLPLHLHDNFFRPGWQYSTFIFVGINVTAMVMIAISYGGMLISIIRTRHLVSISEPFNHKTHADLHLALRFLLIVLTDSLCWAPVAALKVFSLLGGQISADVYGWLVVFVLPINSAFNPLIYTFTTPSFQLRSFKRLALYSIRRIIMASQLQSRKEKSNLFKFQMKPFAVDIIPATDCSGISTPSVKRSLEVNEPIALT
ncbi:relaxin receptor 2-like [Hetaerina americana]|uniref:relaxin receptor 2-like n=1 Tax=Hetaerina americana TaxID=62018 RepID=UPI003A7F3E68